MQNVKGNAADIKIRCIPFTFIVFTFQVQLHTALLTFTF